MNMQKRPWGKLLSRGLSSALPGLALACSSAPPVTTLTPAAAESARPQPPALISEAGEAPEPVNAATGLSPFVNVLADDIAINPAANDRALVEDTAVAFGRGVLVFRDLQSRWYSAPPACPVKTTDGCGHFAVIPSAAPQEDFLDARPQNVDVKDWKAAPHHWSGFSPALDVVYARREGLGLAIDRIDASGNVTPFIEAREGSSDEWGRFQIVESGGRQFFMGEKSGGDLFVAEIVAGAEGRPGTLMEPVSLGIGMVPEWRRSAQAARYIETEHKKRPHYGPLRTVALLDEEPGAWAMVWIEALPPPYSWRAGRPYVRKEAKSAKHGCGGPGSRPLADVSVDKRLRITRFNGTTMISDVVVAKPTKFDDATTRLIVASSPEGVEVNGVTYDRGGKKVATRKISTVLPPRHEDESGASSLPFTRSESLEGAAFDVQSGEGVIVVREGQTFYARTFDALGNFKGEAVVITSPIDHSGSLLHLARVNGRWVGVKRYSDVVHTFDGGEPQRVRLPETSLLVGAGDGTTGRYLRAQGQDSAWGTLTFTDGVLALSEETYALEPGYMGSMFAFAQRKPSEAPFMVTIRWAEEPDTGLAAMSRELTTEPGAIWKRYPTAAIRSSSPTSTRLSMHQVWGDAVAALVEPKGQVQLTWLSTGESKTLDDKQGHLMFKNDTYGAESFYGPLLGSNGALLPSSPGDPVEVSSLAGILSACPIVLPTGPRRFVMACAEALDPLKPGRRVGLRMYRHPKGEAQAAK